MKLEELLDEWLDSVNGTVKVRTFLQYRHIVKVHIKPYFVDMEVSNITTKDLQKYVIVLGERGNKNTGKALGSGTITLILSVLKMGLNYAVMNKYIGASPLIGVRQKKKAIKKVEAFSKEEQQKIEMFSDTNRKYFGVMLALYTGVRIGELLALKWEDFDERESIIKVNKTTYMLKKDNGKWEQENDSPKTQSSNREIPIAIKIKKLLHAHKKQSNSDYIIDNNGKQMQVRHYQYIFESMLKKLNIRHKGFHSLRHTFATRALECGVDIKTLSELLGHSKTSITLDRYVHTSMQQKKKAINRLCKSNNSD
ncbi:MAG: site-specific integrase [Bacillota bacterium]